MIYTIGKGETQRAANIDGLDVCEILYADDALVVIKRREETNIMLHEIEKVSKYYNRKLKKTDVK